MKQYKALNHSNFENNIAIGEQNILFKLYLRGSSVVKFLSTV